MRKLLLLTFCILAFLGLKAQVTISSSNYLHQADYNEMRNIDTVGIAVPDHGTNMEYDYTNLKGDSTVTIPFPAASDSKFPSANRFSYGLASFGGIPVKSKYYSEMNSSGVLRLGSYVIPISAGIGSLTGNPSDTLTFPGSYSVFPNPIFRLKFPMTYGDTWTSSGTFSTDFALTVQSFGLNNTPGKNIEHVTVLDSVVGWGTLRIPYGGGSSQPYDVLLVKNHETVQDSFFLGGSPAPPALLSAFGLQQGQMSSVNRYWFITPDHDGPILELKMSSDWSSAFESYYPDNDITTGILNNMTNNAFNVYPNPVNIDKIQMNLNKDSKGLWNITLTNSIGQTVKTVAINGQGQMNVQIALDENVYNGIYLMTVVDENGNVISRSKVIVNR